MYAIVCNDVEKLVLFWVGKCLCEFQEKLSWGATSFRSSLYPKWVRIEIIIIISFHHEWGDLFTTTKEFEVAVTKALDWFLGLPFEAFIIYHVAFVLEPGILGMIIACTSCMTIYMYSGWRYGMKIETERNREKPRETERNREKPRVIESNRE